MSERWEPCADPRAAVLGRNVRFTVLTPRILRLEWSPDHVFEDRASLAFVNRRMPVCPFRSENTQNDVRIDTGALRLHYRGRGAAFDAENLSIELTVAGRPARWHPGLPAEGNLSGTCRTLDNVLGPAPLEPGLLSRDGWSVVDDSQRVLLNGGDWPWAAPRRSSAALDWYFFGHGHDFRQALYEFTHVAGRVPLPPRYVFGAWWSRYWAYTDAELRALVAEFRRHEVPLSVLVVDMDWHLDGWTGYSWNPRPFPDPEGFLNWAHAEGLRVSLNLHPAEGVGRQEAGFARMAAALELNPDQTPRIPFDCTDRRFMEAYFKHLHHPLEEQGVDFWWIDWQQGSASRLPGLDPLFWLNHLHWTDRRRRSGASRARPLIFSRWGGLGNHRYPIGFSGDTCSDWDSLAFQPYFTAAAGNVGYGYWSHDIGGHYPGPVDPELFVRWMQWGALSPVLRTHATKHFAAERRIWGFDDETFRCAREAWLLRYELLPTIYTACRQTYDEALPLCRPLYYHWPEHEEAYGHPGQYLFGPDLLAAPVCEPINPATGCAAVKVWLPPGEWVHWYSGHVYEGPGEVRLLVPLDQVPLFARAGALIATTRADRGVDAGTVDPLVLNLYVGRRTTEWSARVYEDDGNSCGYERGECRWTRLHASSGDESVRVVVAASQGTFRGAAPSRALELRIHAVAPPRRVRLNGREVRAADGSTPGLWRYDPSTYTLIVQAGERPVDAPCVFDVQQGEAPALRDLLARGLREMVRIVADLPARGAEGASLALRDIASFGEQLAASPPDAERLAKRLRAALPAAFSALAERASSEPAWMHALVRLLGAFLRLNVATELDDARCAVADVEAVVQPALLDEAELAFDIQIPQQPGIHTTRAPETPALTGSRIAARHRRASCCADSPPQMRRMQARLELEVDGRIVLVPAQTTLFPSISAWSVVGPFDRADVQVLDVEFAQRRLLDRQRTLTGLAGRAVTWRKVVRPLSPGSDPRREFFVDLDELFGGGVQDAVAYALAFLHAERERDVQLAIGSSDGARAWLNGFELLSHSVQRPYTPRQDRVAARLSAGPNVLLLRVDQFDGRWGFAVHVDPLDDDPPPRVLATP